MRYNINLMELKLLFLFIIMVYITLLAASLNKSFAFFKSSFT